jgi:hypothetical protein
MKLITASKLGKKFKKFQIALLYIIPAYFIGRILLSVMFGI